jgi:hypothetical protein
MTPLLEAGSDLLRTGAVCAATFAGLAWSAEVLAPYKFSPTTLASSDEILASHGSGVPSVELCALLGHPHLDECPADPSFVFAVNVGGVWIQGLLSIAYRRRNVLVGACALGTPLVNVIAHLGPAVAFRAYNSGC